MSFRATLIGAIMLSGALGGGLAYLNVETRTSSVGNVTASAQDMLRNTMRKFDKRYYTRGPDYGICVADYGRGALGKTNAEITFACECFDKSLRILAGIDQESARTALRPASPLGAKPGDQVAELRTTAAAKAVLDKCDITPAKSGFLSMRGTM